MKNFLIGAGKVAVGLVIACVVLAVLAWGATSFIDWREASRNAPLEVAKEWPAQKIFSPSNTTVHVVTKYRGSSLLYQFGVHGYPAELKEAMEGANRNVGAQFIINFLDADGFRIFSVDVPLLEVTRISNETSGASGVSFSGTTFESADDYRRVKAIEVLWQF